MIYLDLDSDVRQQGLDTTLKRDDSSREERSLFSPFRNHSLFSSESRSVIRRSDGVRNNTTVTGCEKSCAFTFHRVHPVYRAAM